jgi:hypothetical protein
MKKNLSINTVTFELSFQDGSFANEFEIQNNFDAYYPKFQQLKDFSLSGLITISDQDNMMKISDDMYFIVQSLLFGAVAEANLNNKGCYGYRYVSHVSHLAILYSPDIVIIFGDDEPYVPTTFFKPEVVFPAFYDCGQRFINLLKRLHDAGAPRFLLPDLEEVAEKARNALEAKDLI